MLNPYYQFIMYVSMNRIEDQNQNEGLQVWLSDQEILFRSLRNQDSTSFKILYSQYSAAIYGSIIRKINDEEIAKTILIQTFAEVFSGFSSFDEKKLRVFTWINQIALKNIKQIA